MVLMLITGMWSRRDNLSRISIMLYRVDSSKRNDKGFTLIELIVVCALIGILLVTGVPAFKHTLLSDPLGSSSRKMVGYIKEVRGKASRERKPYVIFINTSDNTYHHSEADKQADIDEKEADRKLEDGISFKSVWRRSKNGLIEGSGVELWVSKQGYMDETVIQLENDSSGEGMSLHIESFMSEISIIDGFYEVDIPEKL